MSRKTTGWEWRVALLIFVSPLLLALGNILLGAIDATMTVGVLATAATVIFGGQEAILVGTILSASFLLLICVIVLWRKKERRDRRRRLSRHG